MGKAQTKQAIGDDQAFRQQELANQNQALTGITNQVGRSNKMATGMFNTNPYLDPTYLKQRNILAGDAAGATGQAVTEEAKNYAARTGDNSASVGASLKDASRQRSRDMTDWQAGQFANDYGNWQKMRMNATDVISRNANPYAQVYGGSANAASSSLADQNKLAATPSFWSQFGLAATNAAGQVAAAAMKDSGKGAS